MTKFKHRDVGYLRVSRELKRWIQAMKEGSAVIDPQDLDIIRAFFVTDPLTDRETIENRKDRLLEGSCSWVLEDETYKKWKKDDRFQTLWIHGEPGKGKTMMAISLVDALSEERTLSRVKQTLLAFFFCDNTDSNRNNTLSVMKSLLYQIFRQRPDLINEIRQDFQTQKNTFISLEAVWQILQKILRNSSVQKIYIIIDALDECEEESLEAFLNIMKSFIGTEPKDPLKNCLCTVKWLLTSRSEKRIEEHLRCPRIDLKLNSAQVSQAVVRFISFKVNDLAERKDYDERLKSIIEENLRLKAEGTFLWVALACKELENYNIWDIDPTAALKDLPSGLPQLYDRIMQQIMENKIKRNVEIAKAILGSVLVAVRPLTLEELAVTANLPGNIRHKTGTLAQCVQKTCGSFLTVPHNTVHFVHQSAKDYLLSPAAAKAFSPNMEMENQTVALNCFRFVCNDVFPEHLNETRQPKDDSHVPEKAQSPLEYPVAHWIQHVKASPASIADKFDLNDDFFSSISPLRQAWLNVYWRAHYWGNAPKDFTSLHFAAYFGLDWLVSGILEAASKLDLMKSDSSKMNPLHWAVQKGHQAVVRLLLEKGADVNAESEYGGSALTEAAERGHEAVVRLLVENGADVNATSRYGGSALTEAAGGGHEAVVRLLVKNGADIDVTDGEGRTALYHAASNGHEKTLKLLLEKGAKVEATDTNIKLALGWAGLRNYKAIQSLLLNYGANSETEEYYLELAKRDAASRSVFESFHFDFDFNFDHAAST